MAEQWGTAKDCALRNTLHLLFFYMKEKQDADSEESQEIHGITSAQSFNIVQTTLD